MYFKCELCTSTVVTVMYVNKIPENLIVKKKKKILCIFLSEEGGQCSDSLKINLSAGANSALQSSDGCARQPKRNAARRKQLPECVGYPKG